MNIIGMPLLCPSFFLLLLLIKLFAVFSRDRISQVKHPLGLILLYYFTNYSHAKLAIRFSMDLISRPCKVQPMNPSPFLGY